MQKWFVFISKDGVLCVLCLWLKNSCKIVITIVMSPPHVTVLPDNPKYGRRGSRLFNISIVTNMSSRFLVCLEQQLHIEGDLNRLRPQMTNKRSMDLALSLCKGFSQIEIGIFRLGNRDLTDFYSEIPTEAHSAVT